MSRADLALACLILLAAPAVADEVHWLCGLSADLTRLVCVAEQEPDALPLPVAATATVRGTHFPLDPRRYYTVGMWSPPAEGAMVAQLARATICYRSLDCRVTLALPAYLVAQGR